MFIDYEAQRGYNLWTVKAYGQMLERTGFKQVAAIDKTNLMVNIMRMELKKFYEIKSENRQLFMEKNPKCNNSFSFFCVLEKKIRFLLQYFDKNCHSRRLFFKKAEMPLFV